MKQRLLLGAGLVVIFIAGLHVGEWRAYKVTSVAHEARTSAHKSESRLNMGKKNLSTSNAKDSYFSSSLDSLASREVVMKLNQAWGKPKSERSTELLSALEAVTNAPLSHDVLSALKQILDGGEIDEVHYLLSVLEQREEKSSVAFLADALHHPQQEVRDRALMACEAVAGTIFSDVDSAQAWARSWKPNAAVQELFSPKRSTPEISTVLSTKTGPAGAALRNQGDSAKLSPAPINQQKETPEN